MIGAWNGEKVHLAPNCFEGLGESLGLLKGNDFVQSSMNNLEWWDTGTRIGDGTCYTHEFLSFRHRTTKELCHRRRRIIAQLSARPQEIVGSTTSGNCLNTTGVS